MTDDFIISGKGITKKFGNHVAVDNIDVNITFSIRKLHDFFKPS